MGDDRSPPYKIQISGATLSAVLHRSSASSGDLHGLLFGHLSFSAAATPLSDHHHAPAPPTPTLAITSFLSLPSHLPLPTPPPTALLGSFASRRKSPLHPSLKDSIALNSLSESAPLIFLLITTPLRENVFHTHEYKAFLYKDSTFEPKSIDVVNIGPSFRSQYESFSPHSGFPMMGCGNSMVEDDDVTDGAALGDVCDEGFGAERLSKLLGSESGSTGEAEGLYENMLAKMESLRKLVEESDAKVLKQENYNMGLRHRVAGLETPSQ